uniref:ubiquitinyl hydrolase 1 n=1 Tax=Pseudo-nitzschia delicatissima TaxID=44447 RepID=A0A7S0UJH5_9STRA|mmetsp:Transcript_3074/g.6407  ORF Transcript_3074/g.6407 Transcript_3074/m.6407 type:complete len:235 (+) Transcript_3074:3-707(+)
MMLKGAVETMERRILNRTKGSKTNGTDKNARELQSLEETKCLREDLAKVETRLMELKIEDPDQGDDDKPSDDCDSCDDEDFFFGATDPRDKTPMQRCRAKKCLLLTRTPSVLCCHIQRRYYDPFNGNMEKCVQFVEFPQFLDLSPYCAYGPLAITPWVAGSLRKESKTHAKHGNMPYQLQSVIEHRGNAFGGHYVSYRRDHTGSWFCISDSLVTPVSWREVQTCQAYMLFYEAL